MSNEPSYITTLPDSTTTGPGYWGNSTTTADFTTTNPVMPEWQANVGPWPIGWYEIPEVQTDSGVPYPPTKKSGEEKGKSEDEQIKQHISLLRRRMRDSRGRVRTKSLFREESYGSKGKYQAYFTLNDESYDNYINVREKYLAIGDPTEYRVAIALLGSWKHWQHLRALPWFEERRIQWARELEVKLTSDQIHRMRNFAQNKDSTGYQATKWLAEQPWISKAQKRGRPSEAEKKELLKSAVAEDNETQDEAERIFTPPSASDTLPAN